MWYKKENGIVIKALDIDKIKIISIISSPRSLSYTTNNYTLCLQSELMNQSNVLK